MSGLSVSNNANLNQIEKPTQTNRADEKSAVVDQLSIPEQPTKKDEVSVDNKQGNAITSLDFDNVKPEEKEVKIEKDGNFTHSFNKYDITINELKLDDGKTASFNSKSGLAIMLRSHDNKRDVLVFSNMSDHVKNNSSIPNKAFNIEGTGKSSIYFDKDHNIVIELKNKEKLVIDGKDGETVLSGPFSINYKPEETGANFYSEIKYTGKNPPKSSTSKGDKISW